MATFQANNADNLISSAVGTSSGNNFALVAPVNNVEWLALDGNDTILVANGLLVSNATFRGGAGNDSIVIGDGGAINSSIFGGAGNDTITLGAALTNSTIQSLEGDNTFTTNNANLSDIQTNIGTDVINLSGATQFSTVRAGAGNDSIAVGGNIVNSTIFAGDGNDTVNITGTLNTSVVQSLKGNNTFIGAGVLTASTVQTDSGNDTINLSGNHIRSIIRAGSGNDSIIVGAVTNSSIFAGQGNDTISLTAAATGSSFQTTFGTNTFLVANAARTSTVNIFTGNAAGGDRMVLEGNNAADYDAFFGANNLMNINTLSNSNSLLVEVDANAVSRGITQFVANSTTAAQFLLAGESALSIIGGNGNDTLTGGNGTDFINGTNGNNSLAGGNGNDTILGGLANDTITGGAGADIVTGGLGVDRFVVATAAESNTTAGVDRITDFLGGTDVLALAVAAAGTINTASANADLFTNSAAVASTGVDVAALLANLTVAADALAANAFDHAGDTFVVQITGTSLSGTGVYYLVQNTAADTVVNATDTIIAFTGTSTAQNLTVATLVAA